MGKGKVMAVYVQLALLMMLLLLELRGLAAARCFSQTCATGQTNPKSTERVQTE